MAAIGAQSGHAMTTEELAKVLGHADAGATARKHYLAPGAEQSANVSRVETLLADVPNEPAETPTVDSEFN